MPQGLSLLEKVGHTFRSGSVHKSWQGLCGAVGILNVLSHPLSTSVPSIAQNRFYSHFADGAAEGLNGSAGFSGQVGGEEASALLPWTHSEMLSVPVYVDSCFRCWTHSYATPVSWSFLPQKRVNLTDSVANLIVCRI